jgi:Fe2+ transport system protein FeoA
MDSLCCADSGASYKIIEVKGNCSLRMSEMGLNKGIEIYVISNSHDIIQMKLRDYILAFRKEDVKNVLILKI